jgi:hypothetical protein
MTHRTVDYPLSAVVRLPAVRLLNPDCIRGEQFGRHSGQCRGAPGVIVLPGVRKHGAARSKFVACRRAMDYRVATIRTLTVLRDNPCACAR